MIRKARIYFWFRGTFHKKPITGMTVDSDINCTKRFGMTQAESNMYGADEQLSAMITHGLIDVHCDHAVQDFGVERVEFKFKGKAHLKY